MFAAFLGGWEIILILAVVLILFGPNKLPELGKAMGKALGEFRKGIKEGMEEKESSAKSESTTPSKSI